MQQEDNHLAELKHTLSRLKDERNIMMTDIINQRRDLELMTTELGKMKKQKTYLQGLVREKTEGVRQYDRIISESQKTLQKLSESTKKLLLSVEHQTSKLLQR